MILADLNLTPKNKEKLKELLDEASVFQTVGIPNFNGADSYRCPCCFESTDIMGNAFARGSMSDSVHSSECALNNLYNDLYQ